MLSIIHFINETLFFITTGLYKNNKWSMDGAPGPFVIHKDKSKKKLEESLSNIDKHGPQPPTDEPAKDRFKQWLFYPEKSSKEEKNPLSATVATTSSGSMTQVTFYKFAQHFVDSLPNDQGRGKKPVILFLDGHVSRWSIAALRHLQYNNVYCFFLPSHTSIWSQPNDCGVNKRFHMCIERVTRYKRREGNEPTTSYFNKIFFEA